MISFNKLYVAGPESNQRPLKPQSDSLWTLGDSAAMYTWAAALQNQQNGHCVQRRHRLVCASAQSDQSLRCPHEEKLGPQLSIERTAKCEDWSDWAGAQADLSLRWAQRPFCWFCHEVANIQKVHPFFASGLKNKPPATCWDTCTLRSISHEIMYMVFLLFPLIQERHFLVIIESICTLDHFVLVNRLEGLSLSARRSAVGRSFNCIPGNHRPRISQLDLLLHARDSRNPKPILA